MAVNPARAKTVFLAASELADVAQLAAYLDRECADDTDLRARVEALLRANDAADLGPTESGQPSITLPTGFHRADIPDIKATAEGALRLKYFGDYELLEEIAHGGMGVVYKARQTSLKREVAVKMIRAGALAGPVEVERFHREAQAAANLQHPNIVAIHEVGEQEGQHYFSMDYIQGRDLGQIVKEGPIAFERTVRYVRTIADAIQFAHQRGTLHRDLKPQNVLIDGADQPRITDFGLARLMDDDNQLTQSGTAMGSPSYMPPEQAAGRLIEIGPASDVYSIGAILYELLTGQPPFQGDSILSTLQAVGNDEPVAPRRVRADIPIDLETICLKCLEKSPQARYPTARALSDELSRYLAGDPIVARPAGFIRKTVSWMRRHPMILGALATLAIVVLAFSVFYLWDENAFLRARQNNPGLNRIRGPLSRWIDSWSNLIIFGFYAGLFSLGVLEGKARRIQTKDLFHRPEWTKPLCPLGARAKAFAVICGISFLVGGSVFMGMGIHARIWEGLPKVQFRLSVISKSYLLVCVGYSMLRIVIRDYRLVNFGVQGGRRNAETMSRTLGDSQIDAIDRAIVDVDFVGAVKCYRQAVPESDLAEARVFVAKRFGELKKSRSEAFQFEERSLRTLHRATILRFGLFEVAAVIVLWYLTWPAHPAVALARFAYCLLLSAGLTANLCVMRVWTRVLVLAPGLMGWVLFELLAPRSAPIGYYWFIGIICGVTAMLAGFTVLRPRKVQPAK